jgi:DNA polymerase III subunit delta
MIDKMIKEDRYPPVVLLFGEEEFLVEEDARRLFEAAASTDSTGMNSEIMDGEGMTLDAVLSIARSFPMMSERRVLWIRHFDKVQAVRRKKGTDLMEAYLDSPMESSFIILTADVPKAAGISGSLKKSASAATRKLNTLKYPFDILFRKGAFGEYPQMRESDMTSWLMDRASRSGLSIPHQAAQLMVVRCAGSLRALSQELEKLLAYLDGRKDATADDIIAIVGNERQYNVFELQRALGRRDLAMAVTITTRMLESDRQELLILTMLSRFFMSLFRLADCRQLTDRAAIAREAGIPAFAVADHLTMLDNLGIGTVERALNEIRNAERQLKSTSLDAQIVLSSMLARMMSMPTGARS